LQVPSSLAGGADLNWQLATDNWQLYLERAARRSFLWAAHYCAALATYPEVVTRRAGTFRRSSDPGIVLESQSGLLPAWSERTAGSSPIWSCSVWGLPCHRHYWRRGALLPHLFTLTSPDHRNAQPKCLAG